MAQLRAMHTLIVALNPSIDVEWRVDRVRWEEKNTVHSERRWAGGKGVNVARWLQFLGGRPRLLLPLGGDNGRELAACLRGESLPASIVPIRGETRANIIVTTTTQGQMRFNPVGPGLSRVEWGQIVRRVREELPQSDLLILSGSLPAGVPTDAYARLLRYAHKAGVKTLLDCDGTALDAAVAATPFLVKPNVDELARWSRKKNLSSIEKVQQAAARLSRVTDGWILVSRGGQGAMLVHGRGDYAWSCPAPRVKALNTVGAGDAMLAAVARGLVLSFPPADWLRFAVNVGAGATQCEAGRLPAR